MLLFSETGMMSGGSLVGRRLREVVEVFVELEVADTGKPRTLVAAVRGDPPLAKVHFEAVEARFVVDVLQVARSVSTKPGGPARFETKVAEGREESIVGLPRRWSRARSSQKKSPK